MILAGLAFIWGFSEATLFFLVPDILLGWIVLSKKKHIIRYYGLTLMGALLGGILMYQWGGNNVVTLNAILSRVPAVDEELIRIARDGLASNSLIEMLRGSLSGTPYKIYAANASSMHIDMGLFLLISIPARLVRWVLVGLCTRGIYLLFLQRLSNIQSSIIYLTFWLIFYILFFLA